MIRKSLSIICSLVLGFFASCSPTSKSDLKVAATAVPHAQLLELMKPDLKAQGVDLTIVIAEDYNIPNRALVDKEVDANFFQHLPFMQEQIEQFHYQIKSIANVELEPMGIYSKKIHTLTDLKDSAIVAVPNDPTNEARALLLLQAHGIIELDTSNNLQATIMNITKNPKRIQWIEIDAAMMPRSLQDVDAAVINANFALQAQLSPLKDALVLESKDSPYANIIAVRIGDENRPDIQALKAAMTSEKMKEFILQKYQGAILPAF